MSDVPIDLAAEVMPSVPKAHGPVAAKRSAHEVEWIAPGRHGTAAEALPRIEAICACVGDLFGAVFAVLGTHQGVSHQSLAAALKQYRPDLDDLSKDDVAALFTSAWNGGKCGFEAVLRSRRKGARKMAPLPWVQSS